MVSSREWKRGRSQEITFIVTKDCQLACKYCYQVGKNSNERMSLETAKKTVDYLLSQEYAEIFDFDSVVFSFIGGEPFLEVDLVDSICDYLKIQMYQKNHKWFNSYRFAVTTNGINYASQKVQNFIRKNKKHLSLTITIDGTREKHNINRIWKNSGEEGASRRGSYDDVVRNIPLWLHQFPNAATKVTVSSEDIPFICESVLHLFSLGIKNVYINCVFENVWKVGDDMLFEEQLKLLADKMVGKELYKDCYCSFFERGLGQPMNAKDDHNWCGAGLMVAVDKEGRLYPCMRLAKYSLRSKVARVFGDVQGGINKNLLRPYLNLSRSIQSAKECLECDVASGCAWCQGENYDCSESGTIFYRSTAICKMHKARVRANNYYWGKIDVDSDVRIVEQTKPIDSKCSLDKTLSKPDTIIVLLSTLTTPYCLTGGTSGIVSNRGENEQLLPIEQLKKVVSKVKNGECDVQFVYPDSRLPDEYYEVIRSIPHRDIVPQEANCEGDAVVLKTWCKNIFSSVLGKYHILITTLSDFYSNVSLLGELLCRTDRLNVVFSDERFFSEKEDESYKKALLELSDMILQQWRNGHRVNVNLITDRLYLTEMSNCDAGWKSVALAPNGKYYICPAFYYENDANDCGSIDTEIRIKDQILYKLDHSPLCRSCNAYHCQRCVFLNKQTTLEVNIPSYEQCGKTELELEVTKRFFELWKKN